MLSNSLSTNETRLFQDSKAVYRLSADYQILPFLSTKQNKAVTLSPVKLIGSSFGCNILLPVFSALIFGARIEQSTNKSPISLFSQVFFSTLFFSILFKGTRTVQKLLYARPSISVHTGRVKRSSNVLGTMLIAEE